MYGPILIIRLLYSFLSFLYSAPESFNKKTQLIQKRRAGAKVAKAKAAVKAVEVKKTITARAKKYAKALISEQKEIVREKRNAKASQQYFLPAESKSYLVVRILGTYGVAPKVRKILQLLRLRQINNATLVKANKATLNMLIRVAPYITWGAPSRKTISDLIYKRGYAKVDGQRIRITNELIAKNLRSKDIICVEDLINELYTVGPNFKAANSFLWYFKLNTPTGGFAQKKIGFVEGGDAGNRGDFINQLVARMN